MERKPGTKTKSETETNATIDIGVRRPEVICTWYLKKVLFTNTQVGKTSEKFCSCEKEYHHSYDANDPKFLSISPHTFYFIQEEDNWRRLVLPSMRLEIHTSHRFDHRLLTWYQHFENLLMLVQ